MTNRVFAAQRAGFTWIEAVMLATILLLLLSIMVPVLGNAREQAKQAMCLCNMRNVSIAASVYCEENNDFYPATPHDVQRGDMMAMLSSYIGSATTYRCPSDSSTDWFHSSDPLSLRATNDRRRSYATSVYASFIPERKPGKPSLSRKPIYLKRGFIPSPGTTIYLAETTETQGIQRAKGVIRADWWVPRLPTGLPATIAGQGIAIGRHRFARENYAFSDGHTSTIAFATTFAYHDDIWMVVHDQWNPGFSLRRKPDR